MFPSERSILNLFPAHPLSILFLPSCEFVTVEQRILRRFVFSSEPLFRQEQKKELQGHRPLRIEARHRTDRRSQFFPSGDEFWLPHTDMRICTIRIPHIPYHLLQQPPSFHPVFGPSSGTLVRRLDPHTVGRSTGYGQPPRPTFQL